jgi:hypothetical protein
MNVHHIFLWLDHSGLANVIRSSTWAFAALEVVHLLGLTLLLGSIAVLDLRLLGVGLKDQTVTEIALDTSPWTMIGLGTVTVTGIIMAVAEANRLYDSGPFLIKMVLFVLAVTLTFTFHRGVTKSPPPSAGAALRGGIVSLLLWFGVGFAGRAIAFF